MWDIYKLAIGSLSVAFCHGVIRLFGIRGFFNLAVASRVYEILSWNTLLCNADDGTHIF
jgi:hypothetical protein